MTPKRIIQGTVGLALVAAVMSGCSEPSAVCDDADALKSSFDDLQDINLEAGALSEISTSLDDIKSDLSQLRDDAEDEFATELDAVDTSASALSDSVEAAVEDPSAESITAVSAQMPAFKDAVTGLVDAVQGTC
jgi:hypothetical protein